MRLQRYIISEADKKDALHLKPLVKAFDKVEKSVKSAKNKLQLNTAKKLMANFFKLYSDTIPKLNRPAMIKGMYMSLKQDITKKEGQLT